MAWPIKSWVPGSRPNFSYTVFILSLSRSMPVLDQHQIG
jgi:hypothetical protein